MNKLFKPTWKNILIIIVIFYAIGDVLLGVRMFVNKQIDNYEKQQRLEEMKKWEKEMKFNLDDNNRLYNNLIDSLESSQWKIRNQ